MSEAIPKTNMFRRKRGKQLAVFIDDLARELQRPVNILDIGGRHTYWLNVPSTNIGKLIILNSSDEVRRCTDTAPPCTNALEVGYLVGDARDLGGFADQSLDLVHSNSVIEHVGAWWDMQAMADEACRVGVHGWIQTPAFEFPIEPHYRLPFVHWFSPPIRRMLLLLSAKYRPMNIAKRRYHVDRINLLSRSEVQALFPNATINRERVIITKSYIAKW